MNKEGLRFFIESKTNQTKRTITQTKFILSENKIDDETMNLIDDILSVEEIKGYTEIENLSMEDKQK